MNIPQEAVDAAVKEWMTLDGAPGSWTIEGNIRKILEAAAPHLLSHELEETRLAHVDAVVNAETVDKLNTAIEAVLDISNVRMDSEHGDPTFVAGWEAALEEVNARIKESTGGSDNE